MSDRRRQQPDRSLLISDAAVDFERALIGSILAEPDLVYEINNDIKPEFFQEVRNGHIWRSLLEIVKQGKRPTEGLIRLGMPSTDSQSEIPIKAYFSILIRDAEAMRAAHKFPEILQIVQNLSQRRDMVSRLEREMRRIQSADFGVAPSSLVDGAMRALSSNSATAGDEDMMTYAQWSEQLAQHIQDAFDAGDEGMGLSPGLSGVQRVLGRLLPGKVTILGGLSGGGKSALARQISEAAAVDGFARGLGHGYISSMEMTGREQLARAMGERLGIQPNMIESANLNRMEVERIVSQGIGSMSKIPIVVDQRPGLSLEDIEARMMKAKVRYGGLSFSVIDHALLIRGGSRDSLADRVMNSLIGVKTLAKKFGIPIILLAQVKEDQVIASARGEPSTQHLYGGGSLKQNADAVIFVNRPIEVLRMRGPRGHDKDAEARHANEMEAAMHQAFVYNEKGRGRQSGLRAELWFEGSTVSFRDVEQQTQRVNFVRNQDEGRRPREGEML